MFNYVAITSIFDLLIAHYFETEKELLERMPYCKHWSRETFDKPRIRYHSKQAEKYWRSRGINDPIQSVSIYYKNGKKYYKYR